MVCLNVFPSEAKARPNMQNEIYESIFQTFLSYKRTWVWRKLNEFN